MLVLTRKLNEEIKIGDDITLKIVRIKGGVVRVGIDAPMDFKVLRGELGDWSDEEPPITDANGLPESIDYLEGE